MEIEAIGKDILDSAFAIHSQFGSGLLEKAYRIVLASELRRIGHDVEEEKCCGFTFNGVGYDNMFRVDLLVDDAVVVELKSVGRMEPVFAKQCLTYLRLLDKRLGFVVNFGMPSLRDGIERVVNRLPTDPSSQQPSRTLRTSSETTNSLTQSSPSSRRGEERT